MNWNVDWIYNYKDLYYHMFKELKYDNRYFAIKIKKIQTNDNNNHYIYNRITFLHSDAEDQWLECKDDDTEISNGYTGGEIERKACNECLNETKDLYYKILSELFHFYDDI